MMGSSSPVAAVPRAGRPSVLVWRIAGVCVTCALFGAVVWSEMQNPNLQQNDYPGYLPFIKHMKEHGSVTRPNFLYPLLVLLLHTILPIFSWETALLLITTGSLALTYVVLFKLYRDTSELSSRSVATAALCLMIVAPFSAPIAVFNRHLYYGFLTPNLYHNASILLCKPLALLHLWLVARTLRSGVRLKASQVAALWSLLIVSALAKPNYVLCAAPGFALWWISFDRSREALRKIVVLVVIPAALILLWQYLFTYVIGAYDSGDARIVVAPFAALQTHSTFLIPKLFLSILFPLSLLAARPQLLRLDGMLAAAWCTFVFSLLYTYLLAEDGLRLSHMNFLWGSHIAVFLLFVFSLRALVLHPAPHGIRRSLPMLCLALHVLSGILWYTAELFAPGQYW